MDKAFWKSDWFVGAALSFVFLIAWWLGTALLERLERDAYDIGVRLSARDPSDSVVVVAIDDNSIQNIGRWPWSREVHAQMIDQLEAAGAKTIGNTIVYSEPQVVAGLEWLEQFRRATYALGAAGTDVDKLMGLYDSAEKDMDTDRVLADALSRRENVVLGMQSVPGVPIGNPDEALPNYVVCSAIAENNIGDPSGTFPLPRQAVLAVPPIAAVCETAHGIGHLLSPLDVDGGIRQEPLVVEYFGDFYPS